MKQRFAAALAVLLSALLAALSLRGQAMAEGTTIREAYRWGLANSEHELVVSSLLPAVIAVGCFAAMLYRVVARILASGRRVIVRGRTPRDLYGFDPAVPGVRRHPGLGASPAPDLAPPRDTLGHLFRPLLIWTSPLLKRPTDSSYSDLVVSVPLALIALCSLWVSASASGALFVSAGAGKPSAAPPIGGTVLLGGVLVLALLGLELLSHTSLVRRTPPFPAGAVEEDAATRPSPGSTFMATVVRRELHSVYTGVIEEQSMFAPSAIGYSCYHLRIEPIPSRPVFVCLYVEEEVSEAPSRLEHALATGAPISCRITEDLQVEPIW